MAKEKKIIEWSVSGKVCEYLGQQAIKSLAGWDIYYGQTFAGPEPKYVGKNQLIIRRESRGNMEGWEALGITPESHMRNGLTIVLKCVTARGMSELQAMVKVDEAFEWSRSTAVVHPDGPDVPYEIAKALTEQIATVGPENVFAEWRLRVSFPTRRG